MKRSAVRRIVCIEQRVGALGACRRCGGVGVREYRVEWDPVFDDLHDEDTSSPRPKPGCPDCGKVSGVTVIRVVAEPAPPIPHGLNRV